MADKMQDFSLPDLEIIEVPHDEIPARMFEPIRRQGDHTTAIDEVIQPLKGPLSLGVRMASGKMSRNESSLEVFSSHNRPAFLSEFDESQSNNLKESEDDPQGPESEDEFPCPNSETRPEDGHENYINVVGMVPEFLSTSEDGQLLGMALYGVWDFGLPLLAVLSMAFSLFHDQDATSKVIECGGLWFHYTILDQLLAVFAGFSIFALRQMVLGHFRQTPCTSSLQRFLPKPEDLPIWLRFGRSVFWIHSIMTWIAILYHFKFDFDECVGLAVLVVLDCSALSDLHSPSMPDLVNTTVDCSSFAPHFLREHQAYLLFFIIDTLAVILCDAFKPWLILIPCSFRKRVYLSLVHFLRVRWKWSLWMSALQLQTNNSVKAWVLT